jgi:hypothetical protein
MYIIGIINEGKNNNNQRKENKMAKFKVTYIDGHEAIYEVGDEQGRDGSSWHDAEEILHDRHIISYLCTLDYDPEEIDVPYEIERL